MNLSTHHDLSIEHDDMVTGHVINGSAPHRPFRVRVMVNDRLVAEVLAADLVDVRTTNIDTRALDPDVQEQIKARPLLPAGFTVQIPSVFRAGQHHQVGVFIGDEELWRSETTLFEDTAATIRRHFGDRGQWQITKMELEEGRLIAAGWVSPVEGLEDLDLQLDGHAVPFQLEPASPEDQERLGFGHLLYAFWPGRTFGMWSAELTLSPGEPHRISFASRSGSTTFAPSTDLVLPPSWSEALGRPAPSQEMIRRTGSLSEAHWRFSGVDLVDRLDRLVHEISGQGIDGKRVLDWGCGNGRISQWLAAAGAELHGADIDRDGVAWCAANLPGSFTALPLQPPSDLSAHTFDLIWGCSVMTHLAETEQAAWLEELARITAPGGLVALTTMGWLGFQNCPAPWIRIAGREIRQRGMSDAHIPNRLADVVGETSSYYRNTFNPAEHVEDLWQGPLDVVTIVPGFNADRQDLVVMRKP